MAQSQSQSSRRIPDDIINSILHVPIQSVIGKYIKLKKSGMTYEACCPFHNEKTPSFKVFTKTNTYKCFGCGAGGNAISFVKEKEGIGFSKACRTIAGSHGIPMVSVEFTPEEQKKYKHRESLFVVNQIAMEYFRDNLTGYREEAALGLEYASNRWSVEIIQEFDIGCATGEWAGLYKYARLKGVKEEILLEAGLIKEGKNGNKPYDYFRNRVIFPIHNRYGRIMGFTGRDITDKKKTPKYMNTPETEVYKKGDTLYGIHLAAQSIKENGFAYLVEGNPDVIKLHSLGVMNVVASSGTALTANQITSLKELGKSVTIIADSDQAGMNAMHKSAKMIIGQRMPCNVIMLPTEKGKADPDSFFVSQKHFEKYRDQNNQDYIISYANYLSTKALKTPNHKLQAIDELTFLVTQLGSSAHEIYIDQLAKIIPPKKVWTDKVKSLMAEQDPEEVTEKIPKHVSLSDWQKFGFYDSNNCYYFKTAKYGILRGSNFVLRPLFHIKSIKEAKRLFEITNEHGYQEVIELAQRDLVSLSRFRECVESLGNFLWEASEMELTKLKRFLYEKTDTCIEITQLGWQTQGFYAWGNGIFNGEFKKVDQYGIVPHEDTNYYLPAFSKIFQGEPGLFMNERKFIHLEGSAISLYDYSEKIIKVFGKNAMIALCFYFASLFRDFIFDRFSFFPILNLFGPKGAGKTELAKSLMAFFGKLGKGPNIHNSTKAALADHVAPFKNSCVHFDEYRNDLDLEKVEFFKGVWDGTGRSRMNMDKDKKKETTAVDSAVILSGQQMPTADIALFSRMIYLTFSQTKYSDEENQRFDDMKAIERGGLTHITHELLAHRSHFKENFMRNYESATKALLKKLNGKRVEERVFRNWVIPLVAFATLEPVIKVPFSMDEMISHSATQLLQQSEETDKGNEVSTFWNMVQYLYSDGMIQEDVDFKLKDKIDFTTDKGHFVWNKPKRVLILQHSRIFMLYRKHGKMAGEKILPKDSIDYYLNNSPSFLGKVKSERFKTVDQNGVQKTIMRINKKNGIEEPIKQTSVTTAYAFDFDQLEISIGNSPDEDFDINEKTPNMDTQVEIPGI